MRKTVSVRRATVDDAVVLRDFNLAMALETEDIRLIPDVVEKGVNRVFDHPELGFYLVAELDSRIAGALLITREWSDWRNGMFWWIQSVYVVPEYRRWGVFSSLYETVTGMADGNPDVCGLRLYVDAENKLAQAVYLKRGMNEVSYRFYEMLKYGWEFKEPE